MLSSAWLKSQVKLSPPRNGRKLSRKANQMADGGLEEVGCVIYKSVSHLSVTIVQPRNLNIIGKVIFI